MRAWRVLWPVLLTPGLTLGACRLESTDLSDAGPTDAHVTEGRSTEMPSSACAPLSQCSGTGGGTSPAVTAFTMLRSTAPIAAAWAPDATVAAMQAMSVQQTGMPPATGAWQVRYSSACRQGDLVVSVTAPSYTAQCAGPSGMSIDSRALGVDSSQAVLLGESLGVYPPETMTLYASGSAVGKSGTDPLWVLIDGQNHTAYVDATTAAVVR
jgi:hypothetical protein